jgi:hypothetical protein
VLLADKVALLDTVDGVGTITHIGTHEELLAAVPRYRYLLAADDELDDGAEPRAEWEDEADRKQLDERALIRFARFGYGHHTAAALTLLLHVAPEVFVKWLAMQDYVAITVALRALGVAPDLFESMVGSMPWRDLPTSVDIASVRRRFEALSKEEAMGIFELWRAHAFRRRTGHEQAGAA